MVRAVPLDQQALSIAVAVLAVAVVALAVWVATLQRSATGLRRRLRAVFAGEESIDQVLDRMLADMDRTGKRLDALNALHLELEGVLRKAVQRVGVVRFNPFPDAGGDQSFAIALLDAEGNGIVISSLHGRTDTRIFAKAVTAGRSRHTLSTEEQDAIRSALAPADRTR